MKSLRRAIIIRTLLMLMAVGLISTFVSYQAALYEANQFMDDYLRQFSDATKANIHALEHSSYLLEPEDRFEQIVWTDGVRTSSTRGAPTQVAPPSYSGFGDLNSAGEGWRTFVVRDGNTVTLLTQRQSARQELAQHAAIEISFVILATMFVVWLIVSLTVGRVMRHFSRLGAAIAERSIDASDPLPLDELPREIKPLAGAMNVLIDRQRAALKQQRLFIADSAHELRTPLTALRVQIDNLTNAEQGSATAAAALQGGIVRAAAMLDQLLRMARFDTPTDCPLETVDLAELLKQCVADVIEIGEKNGVDIGLGVLDDAVVRSVRADLQVLLSNILDNAVIYTPRGGSVDCTLKQTAGGARIEIVDTGEGVKPEDLPRLFDRFFRAAALDKMGSGLGLAIVKAIAERHRLKVSIENRSDRSGLKVGVIFPNVNERQDAERMTVHDGSRLRSLGG